MMVHHQKNFEAWLFKKKKKKKKKKEKSEKQFRR